jgi:hypothetical protein
MTELVFELDMDVDLPVEVYDQDQRLVGRALSSDSVAVEPGRYFVEARIPDGSRQQRTVEVGDEDELEIYLDPTESSQPHAVAARGMAEREMLYAEERLFSVRETEPTEAPRGWLTAFRRRPLGGWRVTDREPLFSWTLPSWARLDIGECGALGLQQPDGRTTVIPIPGDYIDLLRFEIFERDGALRLRARVTSEPAHALLSFLNLDLIGEAELLSHSRMLQGEFLLREKVSDPIAAAAGAVALLRLNALDRLHDWTANLAAWFPWLPDGAVLRAEHLALAGDHDGAASLLRTLPTRGLPVLSAALGFATDRLRTYSAYWPEDRALRRALVFATGYALATDFSQPVTTFSGRDPDSPEGASPRDDRGAGSGSEGAVGAPAVAEEIA